MAARINATCLTRLDLVWEFDAGSAKEQVGGRRAQPQQDTCAGNAVQFQGIRQGLGLPCGLPDEPRGEVHTVVDAVSGRCSRRASWLPPAFLKIDADADSPAS